MKKIGLCGLPNTGKSTLLKLLTRKNVEIANYPFTTKKPNIALALVISKNLLELYEITKTKELIAPYLEFFDVPGLIKGSHKGLGLGNEFLSYLRSCDVILEVVRNFRDENILHIEGSIDPERDILIIEEEIIEADKKIIEENIKNLEKRPKEKEKLNALIELKNKLEPFKRFTEFKDILREFNLLVIKEWYLILNGENYNVEKLKNLCFKNIYQMDFKYELEIEEDESLKEELGSQVADFLNIFRKDLNLLEFYTFTNEITQGWFVENGENILSAAKIIHSDFEKKFKYAEVINLEEFKKIKDWNLAKSQGKLQIVGKDYLVKEGDIIKINI